MFFLHPCHTYALPPPNVSSAKRTPLEASSWPSLRLPQALPGLGTGRSLSPHFYYVTATLEAHTRDSPAEKRQAKLLNPYKTLPTPLWPHPPSVHDSWVVCRCVRLGEHLHSACKSVLSFLRDSRQTVGSQTPKTTYPTTKLSELRPPPPKPPGSRNVWILSQRQVTSSKKCWVDAGQGSSRGWM